MAATPSSARRYEEQALQHAENAKLLLEETANAIVGGEYAAHHVRMAQAEATLAVALATLARVS